ncbi:MAG TPA: hypothetical protein VLZ83_05880 [Edaphocola sp.]|nr:hypothetical protein [Edaphocola sp.]
MIKRLVYIPIFAGLFINNAQAQVSDVSVIVAPSLGYNWFDSKSTIENGLMYGVQAGFSFGKVVELRGIFERSPNLNQRFGQYEDDIKVIIPGFSGFQDRNIRVTRIGGEFKTNIPIGNFSPYILLGTGIQKFEREISSNETYVNDNLYGSAGLGFKINLGKRVTFNLEGRGLSYNMDPSSLLYNPGGSTDFDNWINSQNKNRMYNWSATAGLQFYLGGTDNSNFSEMEKAYYNRFSSGMKGLKLTLAPAGAYVDFNKNAPFRSTYLLGGQLGIDFTDYVGLKGYYYQGTADKNPSFDFDNMGIYGVDFVGRLNVPRGIVPYITIGGGMIYIQDNYQGRKIGNITPTVYQDAQSTYFAKGGLGLEIPLGKYVDIYGAANLLYTLNNKKVDLNDLRTPDQLQKSTMYNVGVKLKLGKNAQTKEAVNQDYSERFESTRLAYNKKIKSLEKELKEAYKNNDVEKITKIVEEKKEVETKQKSQELQPNIPSETQLIKLSPQELNELIDRVIKGVETNDEESVEKRIERLELLLNNSNKRTSTEYNNSDYNSIEDNKANNDKLMAEISKLNAKIIEQNKNIETLKANELRAKDKTIVIQEPIKSNPDVTIVQPKYITETPVTGITFNKGLSFFIAPSFGENVNLNLGLRSYTGFSNTKIMFMPEAYIALGKQTGFGVSANGIIPILNKYTNNFSPYLGIGVGVNYYNGELSINPNFIAGTGYQVGKGSLFVDYTVRGNFKYNQVALGYRLRF